MKKPITLIIPANSKFLSLSRTVLTHLLSYYEVPEAVVRKIVLCVDEACSNIIKYGYGCNCDEPIEISYQMLNDNFIVQIRDYGKQCDPSTFTPRQLDELRPGGLGTFFIQEIMDSVHYCTNRDKGTLLTMTKKLGSFSSPTLVKRS
jgi:anti-sigma regulatory factor (Ser/Thr protein kinase)